MRKRRNIRKKPVPGNLSNRPQLTDTSDQSQSKTASLPQYTLSDYGNKGIYYPRFGSFVSLKKQQGLVKDAISRMDMVDLKKLATTANGLCNTKLRRKAW
ncbi:hypothetical protein AYI70_g804 [Smittium culicis]|uniref:Uncharacterized protein n=1 Tax=Smittium culicis TaxID=133412 RepID=A0A1R1X3P6_9FUNG|nr:hypothetical protein AYI70_g11035 [Smittium culicis]OMJ19869.1 hypothetical protein AYI70_g4461 [Smittium culicis]OMJ25593.1 hypothetical protein AYI70_g804 [Smittium culicis]